MKKFSLLVGILICTMSAKAQTTNYQVHSLFILNIAKYSTWPMTSQEFHIVVFGKSRLYDELSKQGMGKNVNGLAIKVTQTENITDIGEAQMIFLADGKSSSLSEINKATENRPVMVVAEREGLFKRGAGFSFVLMDNNTLRYDVNNAELEKRNIRVSKNLTNLANTVM